MFLFRSMFWIAVVLLLLPSEDKPNTKLTQNSAKVHSIDTGRTKDRHNNSYSDLSGFCSRNIDVCSAGSAAFDILQDRAKNAVRIVFSWAQSRTPSQDLSPRQTNKAHKNASLFDIKQQSLAGLVQVSENTNSIMTGTIRPRTRPARRPRKGKSQNTLEIKDLIPLWNGPRSTIRA